MLGRGPPLAPGAGAPPPKLGKSRPLHAESVMSESPPRTPRRVSRIVVYEEIARRSTRLAILYKRRPPP